MVERVQRGWGGNYVSQWCLPCVQQMSVLAMQQPFLGLHQVKTPLCWKHPHCLEKAAPFRRGDLSSMQPNQDTAGSTTW